MTARRTPPPRGRAGSAPFPRPRRRRLLVVLAAVAGAAPAGPLAAQEEGWTVSGEVGASVFFGNTEQTTVTSRVSTELADSAREFLSDVSFNYGEATDESGNDFVNKRSWEVGLSYDHHPFERWSPFVLARVESSFEKRIEARYSGGGGAKYTFRRTDRGRVDLSAALLAERTNPADRVEGEAGEVETLARWSVRFRARRTWDDERLTASNETFYRPRFSQADVFTLSSTTSLSFQLNRVVALKLTFVDNYDSQAEERGARTNNDGQVFFSVLSTF